MTNEHMVLAVTAALVVVVAIALMAYAMSRRSGEPRLPVFATPILTRSEIAFHRKLVAAARRIGGVDVFAQVAMGAVMDADKSLDQNTRRSVRNRFDRKIIDFVIVDAQTNVLLLVELDDSTHEAQRDRDRDAITRAAGHATMRIRGKAAKDDAEIERMVRAHLGQIAS